MAFDDLRRSMTSPISPISGKSESPSMLKRTIGLVTTWALGAVPSLTTRDLIVANAGHHFHPFFTDGRRQQLQLDQYVQAATRGTSTAADCG